MTRLVTPFVPAVEITQSFAPATASRLENLSAFLMGGLASLFRYDNAAEKSLTAVGSYPLKGADPNDFVAYPYPNRPLGSTIDLDYVGVNIEDAHLRYHSSDTGWTRVGSNELASSALSFKETAVAPRGTPVGDRGAKIGDPVLVTGITASSAAFSLYTYIRDISGVYEAGDIEDAVDGSANAATTTQLGTFVAGVNNAATITGTVGAGYSGLTAGVLQEIYFIEVTQGDANNANVRLRVTSASGTDNQASVTPAAFAASTAIGTRGATVTFASAGQFTTGDSFTVTVRQAFTAPTTTVSGTYLPSDRKTRSYIVEAITGGLLTAEPRLKISTADGSEPITYVTLADDSGDSQVFDVGSYGVRMQILGAGTGVFKGDRWTIVANGQEIIEYNHLLLGHSLPQDVTLNSAQPAFVVSLYIKDSIEVPMRIGATSDLNYLPTSSELRLNYGLELTHPEWTDGGDTVAIPLVTPAGSNGSRVHITYRAWENTGDSIQVISDSTSLNDMAGPIDPDNPLKYGLAKALLMANGRPVRYFIVGDPVSLPGWVTALQLAESRRDCYGFVPLSVDPAVVALTAEHVKKMSGPLHNMFRVAWFADKSRDTEVLANSLLSSDEEMITATITDDVESTGNQYTLVGIASSNFELGVAGVRAGDMIRYNFRIDDVGVEVYDEYIVDSVLTENSLLLQTGPAVAELTPKRIEIVRTMTTSDKVVAFTDYVNATFNRTLTPGTLGSESIGGYTGHLTRILPFSTMMDGTLQVPAYFAAAALAAGRSAIAPQQAMTRLPLSGFSGVKGIQEFTPDQLNELTASGGFVVAPNTLGVVTVRHGVTAGDWDNINAREESIISAAHSVAFYLFDSLNPYIGQSNVTDLTLAAIAADLDSAKRYLQTANQTATLGGLIVDLIITNFRPSPVSKDTYLLEGEVVIAGPTNRILFKMLVS